MMDTSNLGPEHQHSVPAVSEVESYPDKEDPGSLKMSQSPPMSRIGLNDHKAGMEGLDKGKINQIILEATKGSKYYENEVKKEQQVTKRIDAMLVNLKEITPAQKMSSQKATDREIEKLETSRVFDHIIVHIDMDAFYAAVEMRDNPSLRDIPMAVGSNSMLSTSNYVARRFGVRAAMPGFIAKKLCPNLVIVRVNFDKYRTVSKEVQEILAQYDPHFSPMGLDESYLDLTAYVKGKLLESGEPEKTREGLIDNTEDDEAISEVPLDPEDELSDDSNSLPMSYWRLAMSTVDELRSRIFAKTGLTASAGIAPNMMLAKVASDMNKPNGQFLVDPTREGVLQFVQGLSIRKICGIGKVTEKMLKALRVTTCRDLYSERAVLNLLFSQTSSHHFLRICLGVGSYDVHSQGNYERKSMSTERTFTEISEVQDLQDKCFELCKSLSDDMMQEGLKGRTVTLKLKLVNFEVRSRAETLPRAVSTSEDLYKCASQLLRLEIAACSPQPLRLRLMGVRVSMLQQTDTRQETLTQFFHTSKTHINELSPTSQAHSDRLTQDDIGNTTTNCTDRNVTILTQTPDDYQKAASHSPTNTVSCDTSTAVCPICSCQVPAENSTFNRHIDECLNHSAIEEVHRETLQDTAADTLSHGTDSPIKTPTTAELLKRKQCSPPIHRSPKKRRQDDPVRNTQKMRTLDSLWKDMDSVLSLLNNYRDTAVYKPLLIELLKEHFRTKCCQELVPELWENFKECECADETLSGLQSALSGLMTGWEGLLTSAPGIDVLDSDQRRSLLSVLHTSLSISRPSCLSTVMEKVIDHSLKVWKTRGSEEDMSMEIDEVTEVTKDYWERFLSLVKVLRELDVLSFFVDHSVVQAVQKEVKAVVSVQCSQEFDSPMIDDLVESLQQSIVNWIQHIYGDDITSHWTSQVQHLTHKSFAELRISELFDILVEYPDSEPALSDLKSSLTKINLRSLLVTSLRTVFEQRLLHPGANTADIITQYISAIKGLRLLDPSGVVLEQVCDPVRTYLRTREDTVRCIVASLIDDSSNELADELVVGEPVLVDLDEESDGEEADYDSWEPDPIDADPSKTSKSRQTSDIISLLVNIYGSREMFVNEYRNLLADRLLQTSGYNTSREVRNLELLKLRFGESNLHFCEVMIKDIADSKRINSYIHTKKTQDNERDTPSSGLEVNAFILSHVFWPNFREEKLKLPEFAQSELDEYCERYKGLKGMRTLEWKTHLGLVEVELELEDRDLSLCVSPFRAAIIYRFGEKSKWTVDSLSGILEAQPSAVRRHLGFWVSQGVLKEKPTDTFTVIERQQKGTKTGGQDVVEDEEESAMASAEDQKESEYQVFWAYIVGMLKSLGKMKLDKIHSTLRMFAMQGDSRKDCTQADLKSFLDRKVKEQQLSVTGGEYHLPR